MMNGTLKDRQTQIEQRILCCWCTRERLSRPFHDVTEIKGAVINPPPLGVPKPWYPLWSVYLLALLRERCCPELRDRTTDDFYVQDAYSLFMMIIRSLRGRAKEIHSVSMISSENIQCFHVFKSVKEIRSLVRKCLYVLHNTLSLIKMRIKEEGCLPCKLQSFNLLLVVVVYTIV